MNTNDIRVKVIKNSGDFDRAVKCGFAVNLFECLDDEMWLVLPSTCTKEQLIDAARKNKFDIIS